MPALSSQDIVCLWEQGEGRPPIEQALLVLRRVFPERSYAELAALPLGQRNALLLQIRAATFGDSLSGSAPCQSCQTPLSFAFSAARLLAMAPEETAEHELSVGSIYGRLRLPTSSDVLVSLQGPAAERGLRLLERCVLSLRREAEPIRAAELTLPERTQLAVELSQRDPLAELQFDLVCPTCRHTTSIWLDIGSYFFAELTHHALRLLSDVERLARAFGWREPDVLGLSPRRRRLYLEAAAR